MAGRIVLCVMTSQGIPLVRYYYRRAFTAATQATRVWKKPTKEPSLEDKKFKSFKNNEVPLPIEIMKDRALLQDLVRYYKDPQKNSGKAD